MIEHLWKCGTQCWQNWRSFAVACCGNTTSTDWIFETTCYLWFSVILSMVSVAKPRNQFNATIRKACCCRRWSGLARVDQDKSSSGSVFFSDSSSRRRILRCKTTWLWFKHEATLCSTDLWHAVCETEPSEVKGWFACGRGGLGESIRHSLHCWGLLKQIQDKWKSLSVWFCLVV